MYICIIDTTLGLTQTSLWQVTMTWSQPLRPSMKGSAAGEYSEKFHVHDVYLCGDINVIVNKIFFYLIS